MSREWFEKKKVAFSSVAGTNGATERQSEAGGTCGGKRRHAFPQIQLARVKAKLSRGRKFRLFATPRISSLDSRINQGTITV